MHPGLFPPPIFLPLSNDLRFCVARPREPAAQQNTQEGAGLAYTRTRDSRDAAHIRVILEFLYCSRLASPASISKRTRWSTVR